VSEFVLYKSISIKIFSFEDFSHENGKIGDGLASFIT
jgi:hypothetical protein